MGQCNASTDHEGGLAYCSETEGHVGPHINDAELMSWPNESKGPPTTRDELNALFEDAGVQPTEVLLAEIEDWADHRDDFCDLEEFRLEQEREREDKAALLTLAAAALTGLAPMAADMTEEWIASKAKRLALATRAALREAGEG